LLTLIDSETRDLKALCYWLILYQVLRVVLLLVLHAAHYHWLTMTQHKSALNRFVPQKTPSHISCVAFWAAIVEQAAKYYWLFVIQQN